MGIFLSLSISKSVTKAEWHRVYEETLKLISHFPLGEIRTVDIHGTKVTCMVKTKEREVVRPFFGSEPKAEWNTCGDTVSLKCAEPFWLPRELVRDDTYDPDAGDALLSHISPDDGDDYPDFGTSPCYNLWGCKTQGEPYHIYLLAVACLIADRLGRKAFVCGDITRGQCRHAVRIANEYLEEPICMPDSCLPDVLIKRVKDLVSLESRCLEVCNKWYLGTKDASYWDVLKEKVSAAAIHEFWRNRFIYSGPGSSSFHDVITEYLSCGFGIRELCGLIDFENAGGRFCYEDLVAWIMDAKMHLREKNCEDLTQIDPEEEQPYTIFSLLGKFFLHMARNRKVDRYVPIEEIREALRLGLEGKIDTDRIIDEYLAKEVKETPFDLSDGNASNEQIEAAAKQDPAEAFNQSMRVKLERMSKDEEEFDICSYEDLMNYEKGQSIREDIKKSLAVVIRFFEKCHTEQYYLDLKNEDVNKKFEWIVLQNRKLVLRDTDWERIYEKLVTDKGSFDRYYSMVRISITNEKILFIVTALVTNDDLYEHSKELAAQMPDEE